jgi:soluble lytic murein transglycosylase-like protein
VDGYNRGLLKGKDWNDALSLFILLGSRISYSLRTQYLYLDGRLVELGLASTDQADAGGELDKAFARDNFGKIVADSGAEEYYRTMAAWRIGITPPYLLSLPDLSARAAPAQDQATASAASAPVAIPATSAASPASAAPVAAAAAVTAATSAASAKVAALPLIENYIAFDLDDLASTQALKYLGSADKTVVASLAFKLSSQGQHYPALRLARDAINRGLGAQYPELYGLVYPKAWPEVVSEGAAIPGIPEALAYAIIRSESVFDPTSVSYAGAVGLTQLMPSTASETAKGLKMKKYSLTDPRDNVRIGMTYYSYMLNRFGGKPIRAMFAYNAGPGRMQTWAKESGELPDDVLLETLNIAQPRQYAKNIIQAALAYGRVHYSIQPQDLLEYLVNAIPLPPPPTPPEPTSAPSVQAPELSAAPASQAAAATAAVDASAGHATQPAPTASPDQSSTNAAAQSQQGTGAAGSGGTM